MWQALRPLTVAVAMVTVPLVKTTGWAAETSPIHLRWQNQPTLPAGTAIEITGLPPESLDYLAHSNWSVDQWHELLTLTTETVGRVADATLPPMAGRYEVDGGTLRFVPAFPMSPGVGYRAEFNPSVLPGGGDGQATRQIFHHRVAPRASKATTVVTAVYPSSSVLPENLLKFYVHLSAPMSRGHVYDYIHLLDSKGQPIELPFLEIDEELWDPELKRLTLLLDPGRIKRGVRSLEESGSVFRVGQHYTLAVSRSWRDSTGSPLKKAYFKEFTIGPSDREPLDPTNWKIEIPSSKSRVALKLSFSESLDRALAERMILVIDEQDQRVSGAVTLGDEERTWRFVPEAPWKAATYRVVIPNTMEDLAGNNVGKPFDVDLFERVDQRPLNTQVTLPFLVK